ncbi:hypothetical protein [Muricoccus radiodurans]|uniref:hypothetical protein n=1 Tax=Muricoccus radiodurans TaxID=2231721 RepID=UPI003CEF70EF
MMELREGELFVAAALRTWVVTLKRPGASHPDWRGIMRLAGLGAVGSDAFHRLMSIVAQSACRSLDVRCPPCPSLSVDEAGMLRLVASVQRGESGGGLDVLSDWLLPEAWPAALDAARRFASAMEEAGLRLPPVFSHRPAGVTLH